MPPPPTLDTRPLAIVTPEMVTVLVMWNTRRVRGRIANRWQRIAAHFATFLVVHLSDVAVYVIITRLTHTQTRPPEQLLFSLASFNGLTYCVVVMVTTAHHSACPKLENSGFVIFSAP